MTYYPSLHAGTENQLPIASLLALQQYEHPSAPCRPWLAILNDPTLPVNLDQQDPTRDWVAYAVGPSDRTADPWELGRKMVLDCQRIGVQMQDRVPLLVGQQQEEDDGARYYVSE